MEKENNGSNGVAASRTVAADKYCATMLLQKHEHVKDEVIVRLSHNNNNRTTFLSSNGNGVSTAFQGWYVDVAKAYPGIDAIP
nr:hypothetical protein CFP56_35219 [Quercus suber]